MTVLIIVDIILVILGIVILTGKGDFLIAGYNTAKKEEKERKELKRQIDKLMKDYSKEKIDGDTYFKKMMDLTTSFQKKHKK